MIPSRILIWRTFFLFFLFLIVLHSVSCKKGDAGAGEKLFTSRGCRSCHTIGAAQRKQGPDLALIGKKLSRGELESWLRDPETFYRIVGRRPVNQGYSPMPRIILTEEEISDLVAYLKSLKNQLPH